MENSVLARQIPLDRTPEYVRIMIIGARLLLHNLGGLKRMRFKKNKKDKTIGCEMKLKVMTRKLKRGPDVKTSAQTPKARI